MRRLHVPSCSDNISKLWALLNFIMPTLFDSHEEFSEWFSKDIESHAAEKGGSLDQGSVDLVEICRFQRIFSAQLSRLHMVLKPFMLRRLKRDVVGELSAKVEVHVPCELAPRQRAMYRALKTKVRFCSGFLPFVDQLAFS